MCCKKINGNIFQRGNDTEKRWQEYYEELNLEHEKGELKKKRKWKDQ